jgi:trk system potassium uptake protein TrkA
VNIVIVGAGEVGKHLAESLSTQLHNITVIEQDEDLADELNEKLDASVLCANGFAASTLAEANMAECDLFLGLTSEDSVNIVAASMAKALGAKKTVARVHASIQREQWLFDYPGHFQIDYFFSSERLAAVELAKFIRNPEGLTVEEIARGRIELQQRVVAPESELIETPFHRLQLPDRVRVACLRRKEVHIIPAGNDHLEPGDVVTVFGDPINLGKMVDLLNPARVRKEERKIVIFGGGEYAFALAQMLEAGPYEVRIMEQDENLCRKLAEQLQSTVVINGDATSLQQLKEEQIGEADFFISTSPDDEDNVMAGLQAKGLGCEYCITLIHRADYADVISRNRQRLGLLGAVSPRLTASRDLLRFIETEKYHQVVALDGDIEVLQFTISEDSPTVGMKIGDIDWPEGGSLVALLREEEAFVPGGDDLLQCNDVVYAVVTAAARKPMVKLLHP